MCKQIMLNRITSVKEQYLKPLISVQKKKKKKKKKKSGSFKNYVTYKLFIYKLYMLKLDLA